MRSALLVTLCLAACDPKPTAGPSAAGAGPGASATSSASAAEAPTGSATAAPAGSATEAAASASAKPTPYSGPTGNLSGTVRIKGDPPPEVKHSYPKECGGEAAATYGKLFRVGQDAALADAIVAATHYQGWVPPKKESIPVTARACTWSTRAIAMTDGQRIEIQNTDTLTSYLPRLDGARQPARIVAVPKGDTVKLYSRGYGRYWLRDDMGRDFMVAHVFHFHYGTTDVTGLDGKYRIEGLPVGKVQVTAMLPMAIEGKREGGSEVDPSPLSVTLPFEIKEGENTFDLELTFDAKKNTPEKPE